jgi:hypothetical protein
MSENIKKYLYQQVEQLAFDGLFYRSENIVFEFYQQ